MTRTKEEQALLADIRTGLADILMRTMKNAEDSGIEWHIFTATVITVLTDTAAGLAIKLGLSGVLC
jgi:hypothetical protein